MLLESALAYLHLAFIFSLIVFQGSLAALLRAEWFNAAVLQRLQRIALIHKVALALVLASGLARLFWGLKPAAWYGANPLMHAKLSVVLLMMALAVPPLRAIKKWQQQYAASGQLPDAAAIQRARRWAMRSSHLMLVIPGFAVLIARGYGRVPGLGG